MKKKTTKTKKSKGDKPIIFISCADEDIEYGKKIKSILIQCYEDEVKIFLYKGIKGGDYWYPEIIKNLKKSSVSIILCSPTSVKKPWINFEAGFCNGVKIKCVPLLFNGCTSENLPGCLKSMQAKSTQSSDELRDGFYSVQKSVKRSGIPNIEEIRDYFSTISLPMEESEKIKNDSPKKTNCNWKERYALFKTYNENFVYALKKSDSNGEPSHILCTTCFNDNKKSIMQPNQQKKGSDEYICLICKTVIDLGQFIDYYEELTPPGSR